MFFLKKIGQRIQSRRDERFRRRIERMLKNQKAITPGENAILLVAEEQTILSDCISGNEQRQP